MTSFKITSVILCLTLLSSSSYGQVETGIDNSDEAKIFKNIIQLNYIDKDVKTIKIPKRKYDSPFFCTEIEQYKNNFIINAITSNRAGREIEFTTNFWYYNTIDKSIKKIIISKADTIESIASNGKALFYSIIKNGKRTIGYVKDKATTVLNNKATSEISNHLDTAKWIKLGFSEDKLFVLSSNYLFQFYNNEWKTLTKYSIDDYYINVLKYRRSISMLPTKNIVIKNNSVYFLQEIVQDRSCNLLKLNITDSKLENYFISLDYRDNYLKQINDFTFLNDNSLLVTASRLMDNYIVINTKDDKVNVWAYNNKLTTTNNEKVDFPITTVLNIGDTLIFASSRGLYFKDSKGFKPLIYFDNYIQSIKEKIGLIHYNFVPRSLKKLSENIYLVGGMWGGLYQVDILNNSIICLDDIDYDKLKSVDINLL
jgi:hypothetical protein